MLVKHIRAGIYVRISQDRVGAGLGVQRQREDCEALAERLGWTVVDVYTDNDTSAFSGKPRQHYTRMLEDIESGRVNGVLAWHTDRLHRNNRELLDYIDLSVRMKLPTQTVTAGPLDLSTANGRAAAITLGAWARAESEHKAERLQRAHEQAAGQGRWRGGPRPFGYTDDAMSLHPVEAPLLQQAYSDIRAGKSLASILKRWEALGVTTTLGRPWTFATLRQALLRPRNYGASVHRGKVVAQGQWDPIVDELTYRAVAAILRTPGRRTTDTNEGKWLLSGLALCGKCDDGTTVTTTNNGAAGGGHTIYRCRAKAHLSRRAQPVDDWVRDVVLARMAKDDARDLLVPDSPTEDLATEADSLRLQLEEAEQLWDEGLLSATRYREKARKLKDDIAALEARMSDATVSPVLSALVDAEDPRRAWDDLTWTQKRLAVDTLCVVTILPVGRGKARVFDPETVQIEPKG